MSVVREEGQLGVTQATSLCPAHLVTVVVHLREEGLLTGARARRGAKSLQESTTPMAARPSAGLALHGLV
jgi:hypothetical protein